MLASPMLERHSYAPNNEDRIACGVIAKANSHLDAAEPWTRPRLALALNKTEARHPVASLLSQQLVSLGVRSTSSPNSGRTLVPSTFPKKAATSHTQPCRLPEAIPEK